MKYIAYSLLLSSLFLFTQCNGKPDRPDSVLNETQKAYDGADLTTTAPVATPPPGAEPPQNAKGVWHYICPDGHPGGAGAAGPCPTCSKMLIHNSAYHEGQTPPQPQLNAPGSPPTPGQTITFDPATGQTSGNVQIDPANNQLITSPDQAKTPEPAQNAAGVWHYTCSNGCAGGAGSATACAVCGTTLAHNSAYHQ